MAGKVPTTVEAVDQFFDALIKSRFTEIIDSNPHSFVELGSLMMQNNSVEHIDNPENEKYITLSSHGKGVKQRLIQEGKIPVQFSGYRVKSGQFIYSRIDARNGAFGIVPDDLDLAVVSKDFPVFDLNTECISSEFLLISLQQDSFLKMIQSSSFGATNRQRIKEDVFSKYKIQ
jgi:type I restriction enzyme S subunit